MKISYISDIHHNFAKACLIYDKSNLGDVLVIAGDADDYRLCPDFVKSFDIPTIFVAGNHEFYYTDNHIEGYEYLKKSFSGTHVHFLENDSVEIDGVNFIGATLWSNLRVMKDVDKGMEGLRNKFKDTNYRALSVEEMIGRFNFSEIYLRSRLEHSKCDKNVVVTHFPPTRINVPEEFLNHRAYGFYDSGCTGLIDNYQPDVWIHGHTHEVLDYKRGETRIVCNVAKDFSKANFKTLIL